MMYILFSREVKTICSTSIGGNFPKTGSKLLL
jgi:hypothetical protein